MDDSLFRTIQEKGFISFVQPNLLLALCNTAIYKPDLIDWLEFELNRRN